MAGWSRAGRTIVWRDKTPEQKRTEIASWGPNPRTPWIYEAWRAVAVLDFITRPS